MRRALHGLLAVAVCGTLAASASALTTRSIKVGDNYFVRDGG